jgi:hypothetical protein
MSGEGQRGREWFERVMGVAAPVVPPAARGVPSAMRRRAEVAHDR